jgi:hypothetical protein
VNTGTGVGSISMPYIEMMFVFLNAEMDYKRNQIAFAATVVVREIPVRL